MAEMRERIDRLRIDVKALAVSAGLNRHTVDKVLAGGVDPRVSTVEALDAALVAEERALFDWLVSLHPKANSQPPPRANPFTAAITGIFNKFNS